MFIDILFSNASYIFFIIQLLDFWIILLLDFYYFTSFGFLKFWILVLSLLSFLLRPNSQKLFPSIWRSMYWAIKKKPSFFHDHKNVFELWVGYRELCNSCKKNWFFNRIFLISPRGTSVIVNPFYGSPKSTNVLLLHNMDVRGYIKLQKISVVIILKH